MPEQPVPIKHHNNLSKPKSNSGKAYFKYSGLAFKLVITVGVFVAGGKLIDQHFQLTFPVFLVTLSILSIGAVLYIILKELK